MKRILMFSIAFFVALGMMSCNKEPSQEGLDSTLTVLWGELGTKAAQEPTAAEQTINSLSFYVFDSHGWLDKSYACSASQIAEKKATFDVKTGPKTVWALANLPASVQAAADACFMINDLRNVAFSLDGQGASSLIMVGSGSKSITTTATDNNLTISLSRPVARVSLLSLKNALPAPYGDITFKHAFLCNVNNAGKVDVVTDAAWINQNGTDVANGGKAATIGQGGHSAQQAWATWYAPSSTVTVPITGVPVTFGTEAAPTAKFYCFPNSSEAVNNGYPSTFTVTATTLMVVVTIKGTDYYYPVPLKTAGSIAANKASTVALTITGLGNTLDDGPFNKLEKGSFTASVTISSWADGATYTESI